MSGTNTGSAVLSATTMVGGIAVLPNTGGNVLLTILSVVCIAASAVVLVSFGLSRLVGKTLR